MALKYVTVRDFWEFLNINESVTAFEPGQKPQKETVASSPVVAGAYTLANMGVNSDSLKLYAADTELTIDTHYTFDSNTSRVTITSTGATALTNNDLEAEYDYNQIGNGLNYNKSVAILEQAENYIDTNCNCVFADQTDTDPSYKKIVDEYQPGKGIYDNIYQVLWNPVVKFQTTVASDYTTGGTTITLTTATGLPSSGTLYIGGYKVSFTSKSSNTLTVPASTPSISAGSVVRGEVVEISVSPNGVEPQYIVLSPGGDYSIDYDTGSIQLLENYYNLEDTWLDKPQDGVMDRFRVSYMHAYHDVGQDAYIPKDIQEAILMHASRHTVQKTILKSLVAGKENPNYQSYGFSKTDIDEILRQYRIIKSSNI